MNRCDHEWRPIDAPYYLCDQCGQYGRKRRGGKGAMTTMSPAEFESHSRERAPRTVPARRFVPNRDPDTTAAVDDVIAGRRRFL